MRLDLAFRSGNRRCSAFETVALLAHRPAAIGKTSPALAARLSAGDDDHDPQRDVGVVEQVAEPKLKRPPMYKVILLNDDYTPMEFVVHVLQKFFGMDMERATQLMLAVHTQGSAVCGIFPRDLAETKSEQVNQYAQENQHPLMSTIEMTD